MILLVAMFIRRRRLKEYKSFKEQLVEMDGVGRDDDGASERDNTSFDHSTLRVEDRPLGG